MKVLLGTSHQLAGGRQRGSSPDGQQRGLGDFKDKFFHWAVLFVQNYHHHFLHIILQGQESPAPELGAPPPEPPSCPREDGMGKGALTALLGRKAKDPESRGLRSSTKHPQTRVVQAEGREFLGPMGIPTP